MKSKLSLTLFLLFSSRGKETGVQTAEFVLESERILRTFKQWNSHLREIMAEVLGVMFGRAWDREKGNGNEVLCL